MCRNSNNSDNNDGFKNHNNKEAIIRDLDILDVNNLAGHGVRVIRGVYAWFNSIEVGYIDIERKHLLKLLQLVQFFFCLFFLFF